MIKVILLPNYYYLLKTLYKKLATTNNTIEWIFLNTNDPQFYEVNKNNLNIEEIKEYASYTEIEPSYVEKLYTEKNRVKLIKIYREYKKVVLKKLNQINPDAILTLNDKGHISIRVCNIWAIKNKKPFLVVQPAFLSFEDSKKTLKDRLKYFFYNTLLRLPLYNKTDSFGMRFKQNILILWGEFFKQQYEHHIGKLPQNYYITGFPNFDNITIKKDKEKKLFEQELNVDLKNKKIVLICTQNMDYWYGEGTNNKINEIYFETIKQNLNVFFILKIHPREPITYYESFFENLSSDNFSITQKYNLYQLMQFVDIQISISSFTSFEAIVYGLPIILLDLDIFKENIRYQTSLAVLEAIAVKAKNPKEITKQISKLIKRDYLEDYNNKRRKFLKNRLLNLDNKSSERIIELILKLIQN